MPDAVALAMVEALPATAPTVGWQTIGALQNGPTSGAAVSPDGTRVYVSHGNSSSVNAFLTTVSSSGQVTAGTSASVARQGVAGAWCNGKHYAIGGFNGVNQALNVVEAYTPAGANGASGVWSSQAATPDNGRAYQSAAVIGNAIYCAGGQETTSSTSFISSALIRYDTTSNTWSSLANMPAARTQGAMVAFGSKLYYLGGLDSGGGSTNTVYVFDTGAGTWANASYAVPTLSSIAAAQIGGAAYLYAGGGSVIAVDLSTGTVTGGVGGTLPSSHGTGSGFVTLAGALYLVSGANTANVDKLDLGAGTGYTAAVLGAKSLMNPLLAGVAATLPNTPPTATADRNVYAQTVQTLKALTYIS